jgi:ribosomal protein S18 acetylase RimI-like enzyme
MAMDISARAYRDDDDRERILELRRACTTPENLIDFPALVDLGELFAPGEATPQHTRLWFDAHDQLIACAIVQLPYRNLYWFIRPGHTTAELEDAISAFGGHEVRAFNLARGEAGTLDTLCRDNDAARVAFLERHDFARQDKGTHLMLRPLADPIPDPVLPPGFTVRAVAGEPEVEAYVALHRAAFGTENMTVAHRLVVMRDADYRAAGDLVAVAPDSTLAAFCVCQIHPAENAAAGQRWGWTDPVGTRPAYQRRGLGRALLLAGMRYLRAQGMATATLFALSTNPAVRLYEAVGYRTVYTYWWYAKAV